VNKTLERKFFPHGALGRRILFGAPEPGKVNRWMTIVGVISDVRTGALDLPAPSQFYMPEMQDVDGHSYSVVLRSQSDAEAMGRSALALVKQLDPEQPVAHVITMEQHVDETLGQPRFRAMLISLFALLALFLAAIGIYGVVAHAVTQRTKEIGIRGALGADAMRIAAAVLTDGMKPVAVGVAIGMLGSAMLTRLLAGILYEVKPDDAATFGLSIVVIAAIGAVACLTPALAAARVDPAIALRVD
jgi:putative ABC transport system permease protein